MGAGYYSIVVGILKRHGCTFVRQGKGSHEIWYSPLNDKKFTVHTTVASRHSANKIFRDAGVPDRI